MKRTFALAGLVFVTAALYLAWVWQQRRADDRRMEAAAEERRMRGWVIRGEDRETAVRIMQFYAASAEVVDGDRNLICYGVRNAASVRIEPPVETLAPSLSRCFWTEPHGDTAYRLVAAGSDGREVSESFQVRVKPAPPRILFMAVSHKEIRAGDPVTMCYGVSHAGAVRIDPIGWALAPAAKNCARFYPKTTREYTLVATGDAGRVDTEKFTVKVR
jgi:hypothetical protein